MKLALGISGASGINLALKFIQALPKNIELFITASNGAKNCFKAESKINLDQKLKEIAPNAKIYENSDLSAPISSGSFKINATAIIPTSMDSLAKISCAISDSLLTRAALVALKEKKPLLLAPREMPLNAISLKHMTKLAKLGAIISPPIMAYYSNPKNLEDMENFIIGKWLDSLNIENSLYSRWEK